ncbi:HAD family phosphatase [soil metagenome]
MIKSSIKNLIFDLGGVIINLDTSATVKALGKLGKITDDETVSIYTLEFFRNYEKGLISDEEFRQQLQLKLSNCSAADINLAWNSMLQDIPPGRLEFLKWLRNNYRMFLLSNTNQIHIDQVNIILKNVCGAADFSHFFDKTYYSHQLKMRKPDTEIFKHVLEENILAAEETLFIDDSAENLTGAEKLGIHTLLVTSENSLFDFFNYGRS